MSDHAPKSAGLTPQERGRDDDAERQFNETVRNLLNTPPKPHSPRKDEPPSKEAGYPGGKRRRKQPS